MWINNLAASASNRLEAAREQPPVPALRNNNRQARGRVAYENAPRRYDSLREPAGEVETVNSGGERRNRRSPDDSGAVRPRLLGLAPRQGKAERGAILV